MDSGEQADKAWLLDIQRKLYTWSRNHPGEAWQDMWGWLTSPRNLRVAWRRVASNRGARSAGVDRLTVKQVEQRIGVERFLGDLGERLRSGRYLPSPVRRVMIPKRGKPGQFRPLGVPTVEDRVVQAAILQLLEPIFEAEFYTVSYGFRPKRSVREAVEHIRLAIKPPKERNQPRRLSPVYQWVIGDIKACFDNIDHHAVMTRLRRRVGDLRVTRLVLAFLKAGYLRKRDFSAPMQVLRRAVSFRPCSPTWCCLPLRRATKGSSRRAVLVTARRMSAPEIRSASSAIASGRRDGRCFCRCGMRMILWCSSPGLNNRLATKRRHWRRTSARS